LRLVELQKYDAAGRSPAQNALFAGNELGAGNWVAIASLVETCKLNAINPNAYLADVLSFKMKGWCTVRWRSLC